jgi:hypothetical protein
LNHHLRSITTSLVPLAEHERIDTASTLSLYAISKSFRASARPRRDPTRVGR